MLKRQPDPSVRVGAAVLVGASALLGLALRLTAAEGNLWLDEIWSLRLLEPARSLADIFLRTPNDNNHYFNSAWLWLVGLDAQPLALRLLSVALGALSVVAAAAACRAQGALAAAVAALLFATSYIFVHYGSEARGYSGMIFSILVAKASLDALLSRPSRAAWGLFGASVCAGAFFHLTMVEATAALALAALAQTAYERRARQGVAIAIVAGLACAPAVALFALGATSPSFRIGFIAPFTSEALFHGLGGAIRTTLGAPASLPDLPAVAIAAISAAGALALLPVSRRWFPVVAIFGLPAIHAAFELPNQFYPRFHLTAAVGLLLLASEAIAALLARGGAARLLGSGAVLLYLGGQTAAAGNFYRYGRGGYAEAARFMADDGPASYSADFAKREIDLTVRFFARAPEAPLRYVEVEKICAEPADWFIDISDPFDTADKPAQRTIGAPEQGCARPYALARVFRAWGLSGHTWWVYRRVD